MDWQLKSLCPPSLSNLNYVCSKTHFPLIFALSILSSPKAARTDTCHAPTSATQGLKRNFNPISPYSCQHIYQQKKPTPPNYYCHRNRISFLINLKKSLKKNIASQNRNNMSSPGGSPLLCTNSSPAFDR